MPGSHTTSWLACRQVCSSSAVRTVCTPHAPDISVESWETAATVSGVGCSAVNSCDFIAARRCCCSSGGTLMKSGMGLTPGCCCCCALISGTPCPLALLWCTCNAAAATRVGGKQVMCLQNACQSALVLSEPSCEGQRRPRASPRENNCAHAAPCCCHAAWHPGSPF